MVGRKSDYNNFSLLPNNIPLFLNKGMLLGTSAYQGENIGVVLPKHRRRNRKTTALFLKAVTRRSPVLVPDVD